VWVCCCKVSKLCEALLLYREQMVCGIAAGQEEIGCGSAAVQRTNCLWDYCSKLGKMCWSVAVKGINCLWDCC